MTTPEPKEDAGLDARVTRAAAVKFDDIAMTEAVLARIQAARKASQPRRTGWVAWVGPAAFASILAATPFVVALYPTDEHTLLIGLATGDPRAILSDAGPGFALGRAFE